MVSESIDRVLKESKVLDLKDLCIEEGKAVWALWVDVVCVSYDGNIYDAALTAVMAALANGKNQNGHLFFTGPPLSLQLLYSLTAD